MGTGRFNYIAPHSSFYHYYIKSSKGFGKSPAGLEPPLIRSVRGDVEWTNQQGSKRNYRKC